MDNVGRHMSMGWSLAICYLAWDVQERGTLKCKNQMETEGMLVCAGTRGWLVCKGMFTGNSFAASRN